MVHHECNIWMKVMKTSGGALKFCKHGFEFEKATTGASVWEKNFKMPGPPPVTSAHDKRFPRSWKGPRILLTPLFADGEMMPAGKTLQCKCKNGVAGTGPLCIKQNAEFCASCDTKAGYKRTDKGTCEGKCCFLLYWFGVGREHL